MDAVAPSRIRSFAAAIVLLFFVSPFLVVLFSLKTLTAPHFDEFLWALKNSLIQAGVSSLLAMVLGFWMALGLLVLSPRIRVLVEYACLLPSLMPSLVSILLLLEYLSPFPTGWIGISIVHGFIYCGFVALSLSRIFAGKLAGLAELAWSLGASKWQMWKNFLSLIAGDLFLVVFLVFIACFTSLSVPMAVGGGRGTTIEVLIYEKVRLTAEWDQAWVLAVFQSMVLFLGSFFYRTKKDSEKSRPMPTVLNSFLGFALLVSYLLFFQFGFVIAAIEGWAQLMDLPKFWEMFLPAATGTLIIGLASGALFFALLALCAYLALNVKWISSFLLGFVPASGALVGFSLFLLFPSYQLELFKFLVALLLLNGILLYRMGLAQALGSLYLQNEIGQSLGASSAKVFREIILPQLQPLLIRLSMVGLLWSVGDFAISRFIFSYDYHLAMVVASLMSNYRIGASLSLMLILLLLVLALTLTLQAILHVYSRKFNK